MASIQVIRDIFKHNNLGDIDKAKKLEGGRIHETWYVKTENKEHVIKIYNPNCSPDMDVPNVLWKNNAPFIIDWEYAGLKHPIVELIYCAIYWSRNANGSIDFGRYEKFINTYLQIRPITNIAYATEALYRVLREFMMWLHYNMRRLSGKWTINENERSIAIEQLHVFTPTVITVHIQTAIFLEPIFRLQRVSSSTHSSH